MRSWILSLVLGAASLGLLAVTPSNVEAQRFWRRPQPYSNYYSPGYSYYSYQYPSYSYYSGPSYYPGYSYNPGYSYYNPGYSSYRYAWPGYMSNYYTPGNYGYYWGY
jgi:hypothetical protein